jgi:hypothetical protein
VSYRGNPKFIWVVKPRRRQKMKETERSAPADGTFQSLRQLIKMLHGHMYCSCSLGVRWCFRNWRSSPAQILYIESDIVETHARTESGPYLITKNNGTHISLPRPLQYHFVSEDTATICQIAWSCRLLFMALSEASSSSTADINWT